MLARSKVKVKVWAKGQIHLIGYNFASNCHRDFKLGSYFSLWNTTPDMTLILTLTLKISPKFKIFETYQLRKTSQNMLRYYAQGIIYCWQDQRSRPRSSKDQIHLIGYNFTSNCQRDFKLYSYFTLKKPYQIWPWPWPWKVHPSSKCFKHQLRKTSHDMLGY